MKPANSTMAGLGTTVFEVMSALAREHNSVNLGQGFPDDKGPEEVRAAAADYLLNGHNQYPPMMGIPELRQAVAEHARRFQGLEVDWQSEVLVTSGATEALGDCLFGLIEPGDEVVLIEPLYDSYLPIVRRAGGIPRLVRLEPPEWRLPKEELAAAFGPKTKLILFNTPMNPCSKVFDREELSFIAELCLEHDVYAICDEVYEHLTDAETPHQPLMTLPEMAERTVRIGSAGKTFSATGWKIGYVSTTPALFSTIAKAHQILVFSVVPHLQRAIAHGLRKDDAYFLGMRDALADKRLRFARGLDALGIRAMPSRGSYFVVGDIGPLGLDMDDLAAARLLTEQAGVATIPCSVFYAGPNPPRTLLRFAVAKQDHILESALARLARWVETRR